jgi:hypothetical protein
MKNTTQRRGKGKSERATVIRKWSSAKKGFEAAMGWSLSSMPVYKSQWLSGNRRIAYVTCLKKSTHGQFWLSAPIGPLDKYHDGIHESQTCVFPRLSQLAAISDGSVLSDGKQQNWRLSQARETFKSPRRQIREYLMVLLSTHQIYVVLVLAYEILPWPAISHQFGKGLTAGAGYIQREPTHVNEPKDLTMTFNKVSTRVSCITRWIMLVIHSEIDRFALQILCINVHSGSSIHLYTQSPKRLHNWRLWTATC